MSMRPKTLRRSIILLVGCLLVSGLVTAGLFWAARQNEKRNLQKRADGIAAFEAGDYPTAIKNLSGYFTRSRNQDPEGLMVFAKARMKVEEPDASHILQPISLLERYLSLKPGDDEAQRLLLGLYPRANRPTEANELADKVLARNPKDIDALRAKAKALLQMNKPDKALETSQKINELAPTDLAGQRLTITAMQRLDQPPEKMLEYTAGLRQAHPTDARFQLLEGFALRLVAPRLPTATTRPTTSNGDGPPKTWEEAEAQARQRLLDAANQPLPDAEFAEWLATELETLATSGVDLGAVPMLHAEAVKMLEKTLALTNNDPKVMLLLAQRLFYAGQYQKLADLLKGIDPQSAMSKSALIAYRALALCEAGQPDQAAPMINALADRAKDDVAASFAKGLRTRFARPAVAPQEAVGLYREALLRDAGNVVVRYYLADSYAGLGEEELALKQLLLTGQTARNWAQPYARASGILRQQGRFAEAQSHAIYAARCLPGDQALVSNVLVCRYHALDSTHPNVGMKAAFLLANLEAFNEKYPDDEATLPLRVGIYARDEARKADAVKLIREFIDRHEAALAAGKPGFSQKLWLDLAAISRHYRLGADQELLQQELLQLAEKTGGMTPELACQRGLKQYDAKKPDAGLDELKKIAEQQGNPVEYRIELARYMEWTNDRKARDLWMALGDDPANAGNRALQCLVLEAPSLWPNRTAGPADDADPQTVRAFLQRTIDRVHTLTSDDGLLWRMARARLLMTSDSVKDKAEAVTTLVDIVNTSPYQLKAQRLLAQAQENIGNTSGAIEQLKTALAYSPDSLEVKLELARLLQSQGLNDDARRYLLQTRDARALAPPLRYQIALMLGQQGDRQAAIGILKTLPTELFRDLMLAEFYAGEGKDSEAKELYEGLLKNENVLNDPSHVSLVLQALARYHATRGNLSQARTELVKLPLGKPDLRDLVRGDFEEQFGNPAAALAEFAAATEAAPADPRSWRALAGFHLRRNDPNQAAVAADAGLRHAPGNDDLAALKALAADAKAMGPRADLAPLVDALSRQPRDRAAQEAWQALRVAAEKKHSPQQAADALKAVADRNPRALPVWMMLVNQYVAAGNLPAASETLGRMLQLFPTVPEVAELAVNLYATTNDPQKVLNAARQWRDRSLANPRRADLAIAEALCQMGNPAKAVEQLQPYISTARQDLDANRDLVVAYTRALMLWGRVADLDEVTAILAPKLPSSPQWRAHWLQLANVGRIPTDRASQWIDQAATHIPANAPGEQVALARAWYELARRLDDPKAFQKAIAILQPLAERPDVDARLLAFYASSLDRAGQFDAAKSAYRQSLAKDPALHFAQNELAFLLVSRGTDADLPEALQLAQSASNAAPRQPAYKDTLARAYLKQRNYGAAVQWFQAALQDDPNNIETLVGLCQALVADKKTAQAADPLGRIERLLPNRAKPDPALEAQIQTLREQLQTTQPSAAGN